jgi:hypothetical protein
MKTTDAFGAYVRQIYDQLGFISGSAGDPHALQ